VGCGEWRVVASGELWVVALDEGEDDVVGMWQARALHLLMSAVKYNYFGAKFSVGAKTIIDYLPAAPHLF